MRTLFRPAALFFLELAAWPLRALPAQEKPLTRTFVQGSEERYQITATVRIETHGVSTEKIGEKTYVSPFTHEAAGQLSWRSIRKINSVAPDNTATIEESLDQFRASCSQPSDGAAADATLQNSVLELCARWQNLSRMTYQEESHGQFHGMPDHANQLAGPGSPFVSLWLRRALRPSAVLPKTPIHFGSPLSHLSGANAVESGKPAGSETIEWMEGRADPPSVILHVTQNLSWKEESRNGTVQSNSPLPPAKITFYADALNTLSLLDASVLSGSRSASYETRQVLDPVPGLPDAPEFGSKLTITVTILRLP
jgi:hypothetical protein